MTALKIGVQFGQSATGVFTVNEKLIATVAGISNAGFTGDGGPATRAELNFPIQAVVDAMGVVFIADTGNGRIQAVNPTTRRAAANSPSA